MFCNILHTPLIFLGFLVCFGMLMLSQYTNIYWCVRVSRFWFFLCTPHSSPLAATCHDISWHHPQIILHLTSGTDCTHFWTHIPSGANGWCSVAEDHSSSGRPADSTTSHTFSGVASTCFTCAGGSAKSWCFNRGFASVAGENASEEGSCHSKTRLAFTSEGRSLHSKTCSATPGCGSNTFRQEASPFVTRKGSSFRLCQFLACGLKSLYNIYPPWN